uniref:hypothetical protein n=1 Tax=Mycoplasmopsis cricetuli TaxID=171283 RepID=UPI00056D98A0
QLKEDTNISNELDILKTENEKSEDLTNNKINEQSQLETAELDKKIKKKQVIFILGHEQDNIVLEYNPDDIEKTFNLPEVPIVDGFDFTGWKYKNSDKNFLKPEQNESDIIEVEAHYKQYWKITYDLNSAEFKNESYFPKKYYEDNIDTEISKLFDSINIKKNFKFEYGDIQNLIVDNYVGDGEGVFDYDEFKENHLNQLKDLHVFVVLPITDKVLFNVIVKYENLDGSINEEWSDDENIENKSPSHYGRIGKRISVNRYNETIGINNVISTCPGCFERSWYKIVVEDKEYQRAEFEKDLENNLPILKKDGTTTLFVYYKGLIDPIPNRIKT